MKVQGSWFMSSHLKVRNEKAGAGVPCQAGCCPWASAASSHGQAYPLSRSHVLHQALCFLKTSQQGHSSWHLRLSHVDSIDKGMSSHSFVVIGVTMSAWGSCVSRAAFRGDQITNIIWRHSKSNPSAPIFVWARKCLPLRIVTWFPALKSSCISEIDPF